MNIEIKTYKPGKETVPDALWEWVKNSEDYLLKYRVSGLQEPYCDDTYTVAYADGEAVCRLWDGYGKHNSPIGNWGAFYTHEEYRGLGIGRLVLEHWKTEFEAREKKPMAFFCTSGSALVPLYAQYGFRPAIQGTTHGYMYCPVGDAPETFDEFCELYYTKTNRLFTRPATLQWRNEIDCLFRFTMTALNLPFNFPDAEFLDRIIANPALGSAQIIFTNEEKVVGWTFTPPNSEKTILLHPQYENLNIE